MNNIETIDDFLKSNCNRLTNGVCQTTSCLKRGGMKKIVNYDKATCPAYEISQRLEKLDIIEDGQYDRAMRGE